MVRSQRDCQADPLLPFLQVLSFMTQWGGARSPTTSAPASPVIGEQHEKGKDYMRDTVTSSDTPGISTGTSTPRNGEKSRSNSRPTSMIQAAHDANGTPPELGPVFGYLNAHANKLYQEGYFLKLHDLDSRGRPSQDRVWNECFAQLVGTVLSLWDAAQLDAAGEDGEVVPTFINLTDASIKMLEALPMNSLGGQSLQNVLSISTAANNRYLLHFNSLHSLTQWTAGIRLSMFEHQTLQEAYTGSLIAGKGKHLNSIRTIMERSRFPTADWARVRFGAGTPWRRCWCVITPPEEKDYHKAQKIQKKRSAYEHVKVYPTGNIKFFETRKIQKKTKPVATITEAYSAYAIYPQSHALIDQSTLVKVEGKITIHTSPESTTEGFIFVMPEVHPAVTGLEILLRWLVPTFDTFALYGRPSKLVADVMDSRSLMFAMPSSRRYGYLELIDVSTLIHTDGSSKWSEREWNEQMKELTMKRMQTIAASPSRFNTNASKASVSRSSLNLTSLKGNVKFGDDTTVSYAPVPRIGSPAPSNGSAATPPRLNSPRIDSLQFRGPRQQRATSDAGNMNLMRPQDGQRHNVESRVEVAPLPPAHSADMDDLRAPDEPWYPTEQPWNKMTGTPNRMDSPQSASNGFEPTPMNNEVADEPFRPVVPPPSFAHASGQAPPSRPDPRPDIMRQNTALDANTMSELQDVNRKSLEAAAALNITNGTTNHVGHQQNFGQQQRGNTYNQQPQHQNYAVPAQSYQQSYQQQQRHVVPQQQQQQNTYYPYAKQQQANQPAPPQQSQYVVGQPPPSLFVPHNQSRGGMHTQDQNHRLPMIPGTPAYEVNQFDLPTRVKSHENSGNGAPGYR